MASPSPSLCEDILILNTEHYLDIVLDSYENTRRYYADDAVHDLGNYIDVFPNMLPYLNKRIDSYSVTLTERSLVHCQLHGDRICTAECDPFNEEFELLDCLAYIKRHLRCHTLIAFWMEDRF